MLTNFNLLIIGASGSIGQATTLKAFQSGAKLYLTYNKNKEKLERFLNQHKIEAELIQLDLTDRLAISKFSQHSFLSILDGMVNTSGVHISGPLLSLTEDEIDEQIAINLTATILLTQIVSRHMISKKSGSIVLTSSVSAHRMIRGHSVYSASKAGLEGFVKALAAEMAKRQVRINAVIPGPVESEMLKNSIEVTGDDPAARVPMNRVIEAQEVANSIIFLLSKHASAITGTSLPVDGGYMLW